MLNTAGIGCICICWASLLRAQIPELSVPGHNLYVDNIQLAQWRFPEIDGRGIRIGIKERLFQLDDVDLKGRVLFSPANNPLYDPTAHAGIMASLTGGAGTSGTRGEGAAPGCYLVPSGFDGDFEADSDTFYQNWQISVQNHSYGLSIQNEYSAAARSFDASVWKNPALVHVFSAGNEGTGMANAGMYAGLKPYANLTGHFKMAKNCLVVGAVDSFGRLQPYSSHGPAYDGRIKPDLCAYGHGGTSESAALVSGTAALLQQTYRMATGALPGSEWVRAILIGTAEDLLSPGPDYLSGWGRLDAARAIQTALEHTYHNSDISAGERLEIPVELATGANRLRVTLCWSEAPSEAGAAKALVTNLDLTVKDPGGQLFYPWRLSAFPHVDSLTLPAGRGVDTLNNTEQLVIMAPAPGRHTIVVTANGQGTVPFSVVWETDTLNRFSWKYPFAGTAVVAGADAILHWNTNLPDAMANIEWKSTLSGTWEPVSTFTDKAGDNFLRWRAPDMYGLAQVRCCIAGNCYVSDTFLIADRLRIKIGFNCPDSVYLYWNRLAPDTRYRVTGLGAQYLEPLLIRNDTFVVLPKNKFPQTHFAVQGLDAQSGKSGMRSPAPDIAEQGVGCYVEVFDAVRQTDDAVALMLKTGTAYGLTKLQFERMVQGRFIPIFGVDTPSGVLFQYLDTKVPPGTQRYRVAMTTTAGAAVYSDILTIYVPGAGGWLVYPNPVQSGAALQILADSPGAMRFRLINLLGSIIREADLEDIWQTIPLDNAASGWYVWEIRRNGEIVGQGKVLVE